MRRFHVHLRVQDLDANVRFYSRLFAAEPAVLKADYAKWLLNDPQLNFAISHRGADTGIEHLGFQVDDDPSLAELGQRLDAAGAAILPEEGTTCCYARSNKLWTEDPQGVRWESFHTFGEATSYAGAAPTQPLTPVQAQTGAGCGCGTPA